MSEVPDTSAPESVAPFESGPVSSDGSLLPETAGTPAEPAKPSAPRVSEVGVREHIARLTGDLPARIKHLEEMARSEKHAIDSKCKAQAHSEKAEVDRRLREDKKTLRKAMNTALSQWNAVLVKLEKDPHPLFEEEDWETPPGGASETPDLRDPAKTEPEVSAP